LKYALDFSLVGKSISGIKWDERTEEKFTLKSLEERLRFIDQLKAGDMLYLVAGGLSGEVAKMASRKGVLVALIAGAKVKETRKKGESVASVLKRLSEEKSNQFNVWFPEEAEVLELTLCFQEWQDLMEERKATANRIRQIFYEEVLRNPEDYKKLRVEELQEMAKEKIKSDAHYRWLSFQEKKAKKELIETITKMKLYRRVFKNFDGCGSLIAARMIVYIRNIKRFPTWEKLATYCGFGLKEERKQRKTRGKSLGYHPQLKSTILQLWIKGQLLLWRRERTELSRLLLARIEKEKADKEAGIKKRGTPVGRAIWWVGRRLVRRIYYKWKAFEKFRA